MSIQDIILKIKSQKGDKGLLLLEEYIPYIIHLIIVGISIIIGFFLGLGFGMEEKREISKKISILDPLPPQIPTFTTHYGQEAVSAPQQSQAVPKSTPTGSFVGSKSGKTYYPAGCGGINRIKPENRVYFTSEEIAQQAGYQRTSTCKSL